MSNRSTLVLVARWRRILAGAEHVGQHVREGAVVPEALRVVGPVHEHLVEKVGLVERHLVVHEVELECRVLVLAGLKVRGGDVTERLVAVVDGALILLRWGGREMGRYNEVTA